MAPGEQTTTASGDAPLDVNILKEIAKKDLVDALNSVRPSMGCRVRGRLMVNQLG